MKNSSHEEIEPMRNLNEFNVCVIFYFALIYLNIHKKRPLETITGRLDLLINTYNSSAKYLHEFHYTQLNTNQGLYSRLSMGNIIYIVLHFRAI